MRKTICMFLSGVCSISLLTGCETGNSDDQYAVSAAVYPVMASYPDENDYINIKGYEEAYEAWLESKNTQLEQAENFTGNLSGFYSSTAGVFLENDGTENKVYSPLNLYIALGMLAETTAVESRQQILDLLQSDSIETVRENVSALWNANYCDDGVVSSILANSLWLNEDMSFYQETMDTLAEVYYASSYQGQMGSEEYTKAFQNWLNEQTGGLLEEQASNIELYEGTVLAIAAAVYYRASWSEEFNESDTETGIFHGNTEDTECEFMNQSGSDNYYWGDNFSAVYKSLKESGGMWLILPDEGVSTDALMQEGGALEQLFTNGTFENSTYLTVNLSMPKFDVVSDFDLIKGLQELGVTDVFDSSVSDFSSMTNAENLFISQMKHAARVTADEEGIEAAAYTVIATMEGSLMVPEEVDFVLDRPFVFVITGTDGSPLFAGVVNSPV